jgi:hypothetical protein
MLESIVKYQESSRRTVGSADPSDEEGSEEPDDTLQMEPDLQG